MYKCILAFKGSLFFKKGFRDGVYAIHTSMHLQKSFVAAWQNALCNATGLA